MRVFAFLMSVTGLFVFLLYHMSFWTAFGAMYMSGMVIVAAIAFFSRSQSMQQMSWVETTEVDQSNPQKRAA